MSLTERALLLTLTAIIAVLSLAGGIASLGEPEVPAWASLSMLGGGWLSLFVFFGVLLDSIKDLRTPGPPSKGSSESPFDVYEYSSSSSTGSAIVTVTTPHF